MIPAVIVDDEISNIENLTVLLRQYCPNVSVVATATTADEGLLAIRAAKPSLLFLDIQLPGKSGLDLLKSIPAPDFEVIFVTAFDQFAIQAIKFSAIDYLLKPIDVNELVNAVDRAVLHIEKDQQNARLQHLVHSLGQPHPMKIAVPGNRETVFIGPETVVYCKSDNNYTIFHLHNHQQHVSSKPIFEYEELLGGHGFIRCHQSYLVNRRFILSWIRTDGDRLLLEGGHEIPVSRNSKEKVKQAIGMK